MPTSGPHPLVIISCGGRKHSTPQPAGQLYTGTYHRLCRRAAAALTDPGQVRILSARHGLVDLHRVLTPYDTRIGDPGAITASVLRQHADTHGLLDREDVIVLAGAAYARLVHVVWPHAIAPLAGAGGIGHQQRRLATIARTRALPVILTTRQGGRSS